MHRMQRTTVALPTFALATLRAEAVRRGVPLAALVAEAVDEKAAAIRGARRPRVALGSSRDGRSAAEVTAAPVARPPD